MYELALRRGLFGPLVLWVKQDSAGTQLSSQASIQPRQQFVDPPLRVGERALGRLLPVEGGGDLLPDQPLDRVLALHSARQRPPGAGDRRDVGAMRKRLEGGALDHRPEGGQVARPGPVEIVPGDEAEEAADGAALLRRTLAPRD